MPVYYFRSDGRSGSFTLTVFQEFITGAPDDSVFDLPEACLRIKAPHISPNENHADSGSEIHVREEKIQLARNLLFTKAHAMKN